MNRKQLCSNEHFNGLLKHFSKITKRVIKENDVNQYSYILDEFVEEMLIKKSSLEEGIEQLFLNYKKNPYKTKSGFEDVVNDEISNKFWLTYTFEDEHGQRSKTPKNIIFRVYVQISNYRKKRLVKWIVPITWKQ